MEIKFWKDKGRKQIDPELFSSKADTVARMIHEEQQASRGRANKPTQLRKFYDEVVRFRTMLQGLPEEQRREEFDRMLPYLNMLNAKAAYAMGRDLISKGFKDFISASLREITDTDDFEAFAGFFESFMGFYKFYDEKGDAQAQGGRR
jgi:CRISPR-associated protein Csm2